MNVISNIKTNWRKKLVLTVSMTGIFCLCYVVLQTYPVFAIWHVPLTLVDRSIPFRPNWVYVYESLWLLMPIAPWLMTSNKDLNRYWAGLIIIYIIGFSFFFLMPARTPRPEMVGQACFLYRKLVDVDNALNAFPSMHVALALFHGFWCSIIFGKQKRHRIVQSFIWLWVLLICLSTLFTKQHAFIDVLAGSILGGLGFGLCYLNIIHRFFFAQLLETGIVDEGILVINDGIVNCYVLQSPEGLICIDTGWRPATVVKAFETLELDVEAVAGVVLTHSHWDHANCAALFPNASIYVARKKLPVKSQKKWNKLNIIDLDENSSYSVAGFSVKPIGTPGHTDDSFSFLVNNSLLFTGDTVLLKNEQVVPFYSIFNRNKHLLLESINKLANIQGVSMILTSHSGISTNPEWAFDSTSSSGIDSEVILESDAT